MATRVSTPRVHPVLLEVQHRLLGLKYWTEVAHIIKNLGQKTCFRPQLLQKPTGNIQANIKQGYLADVDLFQKPFGASKGSKMTGLGQGASNTLFSYFVKLGGPRTGSHSPICPMSSITMLQTPHRTILQKNILTKARDLQWANKVILN